jgi:hypothetical protein
MELEDEIQWVMMEGRKKRTLILANYYSPCYFHILWSKHVKSAKEKAVDSAMDAIGG